MLLVFPESDVLRQARPSPKFRDRHFGAFRRFGYRQDAVVDQLDQSSQYALFDALLIPRFNADRFGASFHIGKVLTHSRSILVCLSEKYALVRLRKG